MDASVVARLLEQTARAVYESRGPKAVHPGQWAVLRYLARAGRQARTVGGVATFLGVTHAPASRAVAALARKELVTVKTDAEDRRVRRIDLTAAGRMLLEQDPVHRLTAAIEALDGRTQTEFARTLETVYARLAKTGS
jgi:DNA-binding MarR family transcriptional regulator